MGKIRKIASPKHDSTLSPFISEFIKKAVSLPLHELPSHLESFPQAWPGLRGDLYHWIPLLNRFDDVYELVISTYHLKDGIQSRPITCEVLLSGIANGEQEVVKPTASDLGALRYPRDGDRALLESIVKFSTILMENCANRSLFASSDLLNHLLNLEPLSTVCAILGLSLRLAQRYSASRLHSRGRGAYLESVNQPMLAHYYKIDLTKVERLAQPFPRVPAAKSASEDEAKSSKFVHDLVALVSDQDLEKSERESLAAIAFEYRDLEQSPTLTGAEDATAVQTPSSPSPLRRDTGTEEQTQQHQTPSVRTIELSAQRISETSISQILQEYLPRIPDNLRFELFTRVRFAHALSGNIHMRREAVMAYLLAVANLSHIYPEQTLQDKVLIQEAGQPRRAQMPYQLCNLVHPPGRGNAGVSRKLQILALNVLESFTNHKTRAAEVSQCLNINVSHGILTYILRKINDELSRDMSIQEEVEMNEYCDALFSLLRTLPAQLVRSREGMVNMGIPEILAESLNLRTRLAERNHIRTIASIDGLVFNTPNGLPSIVNNKGLDYIADLLVHEVHAALTAVREGNGFPEHFKTSQVDYQIAFIPQQLLRNTFRHVNHMMTLNIAGFERLLRNFVESHQMLSSLRTVIGNPTIFGSSVWSSACEVFSNFINSEPTSYPALAEAGLTRTLIQTINFGSGDNQNAERSLAGILPTVDSISAIPLAFGAICLNDTGFESLNESRSLQNFLDIFLSPSHVQALSAAPHDSVENLGAHFDELARHHPRLKPGIIDAVSNLAVRLSEMSHSDSEVQREGIHLELPRPNARRVQDGPGTSSADVDMSDVNTSPARMGAPNGTSRQAASTSDFLIAYTKFLLGFFTNTGLIAAFAERNNGLEKLVDLITSPSRPADFVSTHSTHKVWRLFQVLVDAKPHLVLPLLLHRLKDAVKAAEPLASHPVESAFFQPYVIPSTSQDMDVEQSQTQVHDRGASVLRAMLVIRTICNILSRCLPVPAHRQALNAYAQVNLSDMYVEIIEALGQLQRRSIWETIQLRLCTPASWSQPASDTTQSSGPENLLGSLNLAPATSMESDLQAGNGEVAFNNSVPNSDSKQKANLLTIKKMISDFPFTIIRFYTSMGKSLLVKRSSTDGFQKQLATSVAEALASNLTKTLEFELPASATSKAIDFFRCVAVSQTISALIDGNRNDGSVAGDVRGPQILTLVATCFRKAGGLQTLSSLLQTFFDHSAVAGPETELDSRLKLQRNTFKVSFEGLQMILRLYNNLTQARNIADAPQSAALGREREKDRPEFFSAAQFLVELRHDAVQATLRIWKTELLDQASPNTIKLVCSILKNVLEASGETGAIRKADKLSTQNKPSHRIWKPRHLHENLQRVRDGNVSEDLALEALYRCNDNISNAREYCAATLRNSQFPRLSIPVEYRPSTDTIQAGSAAQQDAASAPSVHETSSTPPTAAEGVEELLDQLQASDMNFDITPQQMGSAIFGRSHQDSPGHMEATATQPAKEANVVTVEDLDTMRTHVQSDLMDRCLAVLGNFSALTFDLSELIIAGVAKSTQVDIRRDAIQTLVSSLVSFQGNEISEVGSQVSAYAHLLGILLQEQDFFTAAKDDLKDDFDNLLQFLSLPTERRPEDSAAWVGHVLLIVERILSEDAQPRTIDWTPPPMDDPHKSDNIATVAAPLIAVDAREGLYWRMLDLLPRVGKDPALALSILRVLVILTRERSLATQLGQRRNMQRIFLLVRQLVGKIDEKLQTAFVIILRHVVEDAETVRHIMRTEIRYWFQAQSNRGFDVATFTRQTYHLVLRQPELFVEVCNEILWIPKYDRSPGNCLLALKPETENETAIAPTTNAGAAATAADVTQESDAERAKPSAEAAEALEKPRATDFKPPIVENPDGVIHFLLSELLAYKDVQDKDSPPSANELKAHSEAASSHNDSSSSPPVAVPSGTQGSGASTADIASRDARSGFEAEEHPHYIYRCFLLRCLSELLAAYNRTKVEFINFSRKADPQATTPSKPRSGILNYLLNALIPCETLKHPTDVASQKRASTSDWAIKVVVSLCARTDERRSRARQETFENESETELLFVRRFVLEHALKAFRDANNSVDSFDVKYSKLLALADLFNRMLQGRPDGTRRRSPDGHVHDNLVPTQKQLAKIMFEKNFIAALTNSISEIDLRVDGANRAVKYILRPLKLLTHTAVDLSMSSDISTSPGQTDDDEISSATSLSDAEDMREETPDLFRNSTLGMFEARGDDDEESEDSNEDEDEDMYGDTYADEMEYDEDDRGNDEDVVSDEDEEMEGVGPIEGMPGDVPMEVQIEIDGGHDDLSDDDDDDDGVSEDDDDDDDGDMEDEDDEIEIMEEVTGEDDDISLDQDHEHDWEEDEDVDEDEDEDGVEGDGLEAEDIDGMQYDAGDEQVSDNDLEPYAGPPALVRGPTDHQGIEPEGNDEADSDEGDEDDDDLDDEQDGYYDDPAEGDDDSDMPPFVWGFAGSRMHPRTMARARHLEDMPIGMHPPPVERIGGAGYRSHRPGGPGPRDDDTINPLLRRDGRDSNFAQAGATNAPSLPFGGPGRGFFDTGIDANGIGLRGPLARLMQLSAADSSNDEDAALMNLLSVLGQRPGAGVQPLPGGGLSFSVSGVPSTHHHHHHHGNQTIDGLDFFRQLHLLDMPVGLHRHQHAVQSSQSPARDASAAVNFEMYSTEQRWQDEARILFGNAFTEKCQRVVNSILHLLYPAAIKLEKSRQQKQEEAQRAMRLAAEEQQRRQDAEREELRLKEEQERLEREEREAADRRELEEIRRELTDENRGTADTGDSMEGIESTGPASGSADADQLPSRSDEQPRIYVDLRGEQVDITDLGIDMEVLNALPEEMREEVITQQMVEHRSQQRNAGVNPTTIDTAFLDALPPEIRDELLQQEAMDRRRQAREDERRARQAQNASDEQPEDMNAADFMASLDPILRQSVLAEADDEMLDQLPPDLAAEARALSGPRRRALDARVFRNVAELNADGSRSRQTVGQEHVDGRAHRRPIVQMIDKSGIATLLRLMFCQVHGNARSSLNGILRNACGNRQTRYEVLGNLLAILQDGSIDVAAVERSFSNLTVRAKQQSAPGKTPQSTKKNHIGHIGSSDASPLTVVSQCLQALDHLTHSVNHVPQYFLSENEAFASMRSKAVRKGKSKDNRSLRYPINALLSLLEREVVINNLNVMEQLAGLLASVTSPLSGLLRSRKDDRARQSAQADQTAITSQGTAPVDSTNSVIVDDVEMNNAQAPNDERSNETERDDIAKVSQDGEARKSRSATPPEIPEENLRIVINLITASESNSKAFRDTLSTMTSLSAIQGARKVFGDELNRQAHQLAQTIREKLQQLLSALEEAENEMEAQSVALTIFPSAGSILIKMSRVLAALDYLFEPKPEEIKDMADEHALKLQEEGKELLNGLYEDAALIELWNQLGSCMSALQQGKRYFFNVATILLPLVEALMIACKRMPSREAAPLKARSEMPSDATGVSSMQSVFFNFTSRHRKILNDLVRHNPKLMSGTFSTLAKNSSVLEFDNKRNYFNRRLHHRTADTRHHHSPPLQLSVRRDQVFLDSYKMLYFKSAEEIKYGKFNIRFIGEEGVDAGGVTREWFQVLARQMFNPDYALFNPVASDRTTFHPNTLSSVNPEHLMFFKFIGRMIGKALYENRVLDCHFSRAVYKRILGKAVSMKDMETIDLDYTKGMEWILNNDITDVITETFSLEQDTFGKTETIDLVPGGREITVTEENKAEYVRKVIDFKLTGAVKEQLEHFLQGFHDVVPAQLIQIFDEGELELLISGMPEVDIDDWKNNTEYHNYNAASSQIQWFWRAVRSFDKEEVAKLLQFVTGAGKVPLNGFKELEGMNGFTRFSIHKDYGSKDRLPSSHTCFNQLDLPEYDNYETLRKNLYTAMTTGNEYFGYA